MRMWMVNPQLMCDKHLLGEHFELHKFRHMFVKKRNMDTRIRLGQIAPEHMKARHDELVKEMLLRGMKHSSEYEECDISYITLKSSIRVESNIKDLYTRCANCKYITERIK